MVAAARRLPPSIETSHAIRVARVTCIFFMMFTHVRPYPQFVNFPEQPLNVALHLFYAIPSLLLGKASVPLLGVVSGWLFARTFRGDWRTNIGRKAKTVLAPLLIWNALLVAMLWAMPAFEPRWVRPDDAGGWVMKLLPFVGYPTNSPLYFLRDLFVCSAMAPMLLWAFRRWDGRAMAAVFVLACLFAVLAPEEGVLTRPVILPTFVAGLILATRGIDPLAKALRDRRVLALAAFWVVIEMSVALPLTGTDYVWWDEVGALPELLTRFALAILLWSGIVAVARRPAGQLIALFEPAIFFVFCSHHIIQLLFWAAFGSQIQHGAFSPAYPFYFLAQPTMAMLIGIAGYRALGAAAPGLLAVLTGGRGAGEGRRRRAAA